MGVKLHLSNTPGCGTTPQQSTHITHFLSRSFSKGENKRS
ncbi:hypothetical protein AtDm6_0521 [Acetobacter tropicalis]|uniref:Uncharacterized protein n=1 Tax=Acetobacter tropicalis TaxID=104102 RepID=A0A094ZT89_9PROT|nr:hypothetical protein AtDm6_0521 [Acetobacter tropicalis]